MVPAIRSRRGHMDPICLFFTLIVAVVGGLLLRKLFAGAEASNLFLAVFLATVMLSTIVHFAHHGLSPLSMPFVFFNFLIIVFVFRFIRGEFAFVGEHLKAIVAAAIAFDFLKDLVP